MYKYGRRTWAKVTDAAPHTRNARRQCPFLVKVLTHNDNTRQEKQPVPNTDNDALRDQQLPIRLTDTGHHHAEYSEESATVHERTQVSCIIERTSNDTDEEEKETLHGADPCYFGVGLRFLTCQRVVVLINTIAIDYAPGQLGVTVSNRKTDSMKGRAG